MNWTIRSEVFLQVCNLPVLKITAIILLYTNVPGSVWVKLISHFFTRKMAKSSPFLFLFLSWQQQEQDPTNLYISNLPLTMDEQELEAMLKPFGQVVSTRVLRDTNGASRGVGFARWGFSIWPRITRSTAVVTLSFFVNSPQCTNRGSRLQRPSGNQVSWKTPGVLPAATQTLQTLPWFLVPVSSLKI